MFVYSVSIREDTLVRSGAQLCRAEYARSRDREAPLVILRDLLNSRAFSISLGYIGGLGCEIIGLFSLLR